MKGTVLDYSIQDNRGIISGDDGKRYRFSGAGWKASKVPISGNHVDFAIHTDGQAVEIYLMQETGYTASPKNRVVRDGKNPANTNIDILMGALGLVGLFIQFARQSENEISWGHFVGGFIGSIVVGIILILFLSAACAAAIGASG